jgi:hypothetical protein
MFSKLRARIRSRWGLRRLTAAQRLAFDWCEKSLKTAKRLERGREKLIVLSERFDADLAEAASLAKQHSSVVDALRNENKILGEVTIPTLTAQHNLILQRIRAETELQVRRQVAANTTDEDR